MQTVNIADLKNNLSAWLERVRNGEELIVKDRNTPIARVLPLTPGEDLDAEESSLIAAGLMRPPLGEISSEFLDYPAPEVSLENVRAAMRAERDAD